MGRLRRSWIRLRRGLPAADGPVYVFHHIPKTGGVSVRSALGEWFYRLVDYRPRVDRTDFHSDRITRDPIDLRSVRRGDCLVGHWEAPGFYLHERYPEVLTSPRFKVFTFVRHPLQLQLSLYHWERRQGKDFGVHELQEELLKRPNFIAERIPCPEGRVGDVLGRYFFVGITDRLQASFDALAAILKLPSVPLPHRNQSRTTSAVPDFEDGFLDEFRAANHLDYAIFEKAATGLRIGPAAGAGALRTADVVPPSVTATRRHRPRNVDAEVGGRGEHDEA